MLGLPNDMLFIFSTATMPLAIILNIVSARVFFKRSLNSASTNMGLLNGTHCIFNVFSLAFSFIYNFMDWMNMTYESSDFLCPFNMFWTKFIGHLPSYQQVLVAFFMWLSIAYTNKYKQPHLLILYKPLVFLNLTNL